MLTLFASEISACVGFHKYKKSWEVLRDLFQRHQHGTLYRAAVKRLEVNQNIHVADLEEKKARVWNEFDTESLNQLRETQVTNSVQLNQLIDSFETHLKQKEHHFVQVKKELKQNLETLEEKLQHHQEEKNRLFTGDIFEPKAADPLVDQLKQELQQKQQELEQVTQTWTDFKEVKKTLISEKITEFGKRKESEVVESGVLGEIKNNNVETFREIMGQTPCPWCIVGKVDGFKDNKLIEIKNRKSKIYNPLPEYDYIQVQVYLQILQRNEALVIQCLTDPFGDIQSVEQTITRDVDFWQNVIAPLLSKFVQVAHFLLQNTAAQDEFLTTPDGRKTFLFNRWLKERDRKTQPGKKTTTRKKTGTKSTTKSTTRSTKSQPKSRTIQKPASKRHQTTLAHISPPTEPVVYQYSIHTDLQEYVDHESQYTQVPLFQRIPWSWQEFFQNHTLHESWNVLNQELCRQYQTVPVIPPQEWIFRAFSYFPPEQTRVVLLGQDPYPTMGEAQGLSFSVPDQHTLPPTLHNIFTELQQDVQVTRCSGDLQDWARQGVLLLNCSLTTKVNRSKSHEALWQAFTQYTVEQLSQRNAHIVFFLWGKSAQEVERFIDASKHTILKAPHPSPYSVQTGFFGCRHFSQCNRALQQHQQTPIQW